MISFMLHPEPSHMNAPDAWAVWQNTADVDHEGDPVTHTECIAHGISLVEALEEIRLAVTLS